jgi:hypothetical protein
MFVCARTDPSAAGSNAHRYAAPAFESWQAELARGNRMTETRRPPGAARRGEGAANCLQFECKCLFNFQTAKDAKRQCRVVIASQRVARTRPTTGSAKQSILPRNEKKEWIASLRSQLRPDATSRSRGAIRPRFAFISRPQGGRGECRVPAAPAASYALCIGKKHTSNNEYTGTPGIPARNGFYGLCRALGDRALLPPSSCEYGMSAPGRANMPPQNLTPASGRQNHTIWPYAGSISRPRA